MKNHLLANFAIQQYNMRIPLTLLLITTLLIGCTSVSKKLESLDAEVMGIHDEVMPKMDDIYSLKKELRAYMKKAPDQTPVIVDHVRQLEAADDHMMDWMAQYRPGEFRGSDKEKEAYLLDQLDKVKAMKTDMLTSIENSTNLLKELQDAH